MFQVEALCRACGSEDLEKIIEFGATPLADRIPTKKQLTEYEPFVPLTLAFCSSCSLAQILETVSPEVLFCEDYPYFSSVSNGLLAHFRESALDIIDSKALGQDSLVIEAASNDGYMLGNFVERGIPVQGIDPARGPAKAAQEKGISTLNTFFTLDLAKELRKKHPNGADVFLANNVLAHVPDLNGFVEGIRTLLKANGTAVIEAPYLVDLVDQCEFDTVYHQHLCYFSVTALDKLFRNHNLFLNDVKQTAIHGGSLRLFVEPYNAAKDSLKKLLHRELERKVDRIAFYQDFAERVARIKVRLRSLLNNLKQQGKRIAGYGAAAKGNTMMSYVGIDKIHLDYIADKNDFKQGRYMGGNHVPIVSPERLLDTMPDYILILAWNFAAEIIKDQAEYKNQGGQFIIPIPEPKIV